MSKAPVFRTKQCAAHGHPEIAFMATDVLGPADHIVEWLEEEVSLGARFLVGRRHVQRHRLACARLGTEPEFPSMLEFAVVSPTLCGAKGGFPMRHDAVESPNSGWVIAEPGYASTEAQRMSLYQLAIARPDITPFVALPRARRRPGQSSATDNL